MTTSSTITDSIFYGDLVGSADSQQLLTSIDEHPGDTVTNCALDLSAIYYLNSAGIDVLLSLLTKFRSRASKMVLIKPANHSKKMLALPKLSNVLAIATAHQQSTPATS